MKIEIEGVKFEVSKINAFDAKEYLDNRDDEILYSSLSIIKDGKKISLSDSTLINEHVSDWMVLDKLIHISKEENFSFLEKRRFRRLPESGITSASPFYCDPLFHSLVSNQYASMAELKTILTLEDAFDLMDSLTTNKLNEYYALKSSQKN